MSGAAPQGRDGPPRRRRHRRVDAAATRAGTDGSDDVPGPDAVLGARREVAERSGHAHGGEHAHRGDQARDAWIVAERPPHWD